MAGFRPGIFSAIMLADWRRQNSFLALNECHEWSVGRVLVLVLVVGVRWGGLVTGEIH